MKTSLHGSALKLTQSSNIQEQVYAILVDHEN